jgi:predicted DNA-binding transcriptional regulator AlpA
MTRARALAPWPRSLRSARAAEYAGYETERSFRLAVSDGAMPPPFELGGADAWDIVDLDEAIDALKAGAARAGNWREKAHERAQTRRVAGRSR